MQDSDTRLAALLSAVQIEAPATNLAERIIAATRPVMAGSRVVSTSVWDALRELLLPKPAFALALALVMGIALGTQTVTASAVAPTNSYDNFLAFDGDVL